MSVLPELEKECFFIAPIGPDNSEERNRSDGVLEFIVARAATELGLEAIRGDQLGEPGQITLQVIEHVLGAKAAVADLTGRNPNVYYELAIRHTAKLPTVLICERGENLPFDIASMRTIFFSHTDLRDADRCRSEIVRQLRRALDGAVESPITTSVDLQSLRTGNTVERSVAELVTGVSQVEKIVSDVWRQVRGIDTAANRNRAYEEIMTRQLSLMQDLEEQLRDLDALARDKHDPEVETAIGRARELVWAISLSYPTGTTWRKSSYQEDPEGGVAVRAVSSGRTRTISPSATDDVAPPENEESPDDEDG